jgi:hypothetical protein
MSEARISMRMPEFMLSDVAAGLGFSADSGKSHVIRFCLYRLAGKSPSEARELASPPRGGGNMKTGGRKVTQVIVPEELLTEVRKALPDVTNESYLVRYAMAYSLRYSPEECDSFAKRKLGRPYKETAA